MSLKPGSSVRHVFLTLSQGKVHKKNYSQARLPAYKCLKLSMKFICKETCKKNRLNRLNEDISRSNRCC